MKTPRLPQAAALPARPVPPNELSDDSIGRMMRRAGKPRIVFFYGGQAATRPRRSLLAWLRKEGKATPFLVRDDVPSEARIVTLSVDEAIAEADGAIALITPDERSTHGAPNVLAEVAQWIGARGKEKILVLRHEDVPEHSNDGGKVQPRFKITPIERKVAIRRFLTGLSATQAWGYLVINESTQRIKPWAIVGCFEVDHNFSLRGSGWALMTERATRPVKWTNWAGVWRDGPPASSKIVFRTFPLAPARRLMGVPVKPLEGEWLFRGRIGQSTYDGRLVHDLVVEGLRYGDTGRVHVWRLPRSPVRSWAVLAPRVLRDARHILEAFPHSERVR